MQSERLDLDKLDSSMLLLLLAFIQLSFINIFRETFNDLIVLKGGNFSL